MADTTPLLINTLSRYAGGPNNRGLGGGATGSVAWGTANLVLYLPFTLPWTYTVRRIFWVNGAAVAGNVVAGIYSMAGTQLYATAATAQAGTNVSQYVTLPSPLVLSSGPGFIAIGCSSVTAQLQMMNISVDRGRLSGLYQQAAAIPLPATATFAAWSQTFGNPLCGFTRTASGY
jgi:hypothetical protein